LLMPSRPLVLDSMYEGVSSCNAQQQETAQPSKKRARLQAIFSGELACTLAAWQEPQHHVQTAFTHRSALILRCSAQGMRVLQLCWGAYHPVH
jgi:hypothetical protein